MFELKYYDEYNELMLCYISQQLRDTWKPSPTSYTTRNLNRRWKEHLSFPRRRAKSRQFQEHSVNLLWIWYNTMTGENNSWEKCTWIVHDERFLLDGMLHAVHFTLKVHKIRGKMQYWNHVTHTHAHKHKCLDKVTFYLRSSISEGKSTSFVNI